MTVAQKCLCLAAIAQLCLALVLGLPGHMSVDSLIQLYEGVSGEFISFNPPVMSILLGLLDKVGTAPALFVLLSCAMISMSFCLLIRESARSVSAWRVVAAMVLMLNPVILLYSGIVWKDVLFAHVVVLAFLAIDSCPQTQRRKFVWAGLTWALLVVMLSIRQQGLIFALPLGIWIAWRLFPRIAIAAPLACVLLIAAGLVNTAISDYAQARKFNGDPPGLEVGLKILMRYDMVGTLALGGKPPVGMNSAVVEEMLPEVQKYSSYRVDTLDGPSAKFWSQSLAQTSADWMGHIAVAPKSYLKHRVMVGMRILGIGNLWQCLPYHRGVSANVRIAEVDGDLAQHLGLETSTGSFAPEVFTFVNAAEFTPLFRHWFYLLVSAALCAYFAWRRDWIATTLSLCSMLYTGSYVAVGIACDFRYGYTLPVVATLLSIRALLQPPGRENTAT